MHIIWKNHAHTNENLRTSFSAPTSFLIGCGRMMIFWGTRNKKAARFFFASFLFLVGAACFFVKLGLLSNLDIDIVTSTWPFWQMSSLLHHALFKKGHNFTNSWKTEGKTKPKFQCTLTPLYYCILHLHKKKLDHHEMSSRKVRRKWKWCENHHLWDVRREWLLQWRGSHHLRT